MQTPRFKQFSQRRRVGIGLAGTLALGCGVQGPPGDKGDRGEPGLSTPTLTLLVPSGLFAARDSLLQIAGSGTHFTSSSRVEFDDSAIRVQKVEAGSPGNLRVTVSISEKARIGPHDVTVYSEAPEGGMPERVTLTSGFSVLPSLRADPVGNTKSVPVGGIAEFSVSNLDREAPFQSTPQVTSGQLLHSVTSATASNFAGTLFVNAIAEPGRLDLSLSVKDPVGRVTSYVSDPKDPAAVEITPRSATQLLPGILAAGQILPSAKQTNLYKFSPQADEQVVLLSLSNLGTRLSTLGFLGAVAGQSGRFGEGFFILPSVAQQVTSAVSLVYLPTKGDAYVSIAARDLSGAATGYTYDASIRVGAAKKITTLKEPQNPDAANKPLFDIGTLDAPYVGTDGAIDTAGDLDYIRFKANRDGRIFVQATSPGSLTLPSVAIYQSNCTTLVVGAKQVAAEVSATVNTTYCTRISGSATPYLFVVSPDL